MARRGTRANTANTMNFTGLFSLSDTPFKDIGLYSERKAGRANEFGVTDCGEVLAQRTPLGSFIAR